MHIRSCPGHGYLRRAPEPCRANKFGVIAAPGALVLLLAVALGACGTAVHRDPLLKIRVLYMFPNDAARSVTCTGGCAGTWPPLVIADGHHPSATGAAERTELGTLPDPNTGERVVTYDGNPLYRYAGDTAPHRANGQDIESDGGPWYVLTPAGKPVTAPVTQANTAP